MKRATLVLIVATLLCGAALAATVKTAQEPRHAPAAVTPAAAPQGEAASAPPAVPAAEPVADEHRNAATQPEHPAQGAEPAVEHKAAGDHGAAIAHEAHEAEASESPWATIARLFNFGLLAGAIVYLLRSPFGAFLENRKVQIRKELTDAAALRATATTQLSVIDEKLKALPSELASLEQRGAAEIAAEEERIRQAAEVERARLLENAQREIARRGHIAERRLVQRAGELAVEVATERVKRVITDADQARLVDRYLHQVRPETIGS